MSQNSLPPSFKVCATCALWGGARGTDPLRNYSIFESDQSGQCLGGGFNMAQMNPTASCGSWVVWAVLSR
jgi:hypothetical protein